MLQAYLGALKKRPYVVKSVSAAVLFGAGDTFSQRESPIRDTRRSAAFVAYASLVYAPTQHLWFIWTETNVAAKMRPLAQVQYFPN